MKCIEFSVSIDLLSDDWVLYTSKTSDKNKTKILKFSEHYKTIIHCNFIISHTIFLHAILLSGTKTQIWQNFKIFHRGGVDFWRNSPIPWSEVDAPCLLCLSSLINAALFSASRDSSWNCRWCKFVRHKKRTKTLEVSMMVYNYCLMLYMLYTSRFFWRAT